MVKNDYKSIWIVHIISIKDVILIPSLKDSEYWVNFFVLKPFVDDQFHFQMKTFGKNSLSFGGKRIILKIK